MKQTNPFANLNLHPKVYLWKKKCKEVAIGNHELMDKVWESRNKPRSPLNPETYKDTDNANIQAQNKHKEL